MKKALIVLMILLATAVAVAFFLGGVGSLVSLERLRRLESLTIVDKNRSLNSLISLNSLVSLTYMASLPIPYIYNVERNLRLELKKMPFLFCELVFITIFAPDFGLLRMGNPRNHRFFERTK